MKLAKNRLYVEKYVKCSNCGMLIFEPTTASEDNTRAVDGKLFCSAWCVAWESDRSARRGTEGAAR